MSEALETRIADLETRIAILETALAELRGDPNADHEPEIKRLMKEAAELDSLPD